MKKHAVTLVVAMVGFGLAYIGVMVGSDLVWLHQQRQANELQMAARELIAKQQQAPKPEAP